MIVLNNINKDQNVHRYAVRGEKVIERERKIETERERAREREPERNKQIKLGRFRQNVIQKCYAKT